MIARVRRSVKRSAAAVTRRFVARGDERRVVILCYHSVHPDKPFATVSPTVFEEHLSWLTRNVDVIPFSDSVDAASAPAYPRPAVAITFDDGYRDNYTFALPLLKKFGLTATFFITAGLAQNDPAVIARFATLRRVRVGEIEPLTWQHIRELLAEGMAVGAHTYSHPCLSRLTIAAQEDELERSKLLLEHELGISIDAMAYPFGKPRVHYGSHSVTLARRLGYGQAASAVARGLYPDVCPWEVPRFFVARDGIAQLAAKIRGDWDYLGFWQEHVPTTVARVVSPQDFRV